MNNEGWHVEQAKDLAQVELEGNVRIDKVEEQM